METIIRKQAIERYIKGEAPKLIYTDLGRSKNWFFKWLRRYKSGDANWYKDKSKAPKHSPTVISTTDKQRIISTRRQLESQKFAQIGASAIKWELSKSGFDFPSDRTINRVLKREGLIKKKRRTFPRALSTRILKSHLQLTTFTRPILSVHVTSKVTANFTRSM
jgi:putative transposase